MTQTKFGITIYHKNLSAVDFLAEVLREFPTDFDWLVWSKERINTYNQQFKSKLKFFDWTKDVSLQPVTHFPIGFAERLVEKGSFKIGVCGIGDNRKIISFANFRKHLVKIDDQVTLVTLNF